MLGGGWLQLEEVLIAHYNFGILGLKGVKDLAHVEAGGDVDLLEVGVVGYEGGKTERGLQVQANEDGLLPRLREEAAP